MPAYSWGIAFGTNATLGMDVSQSGRYLYVTMYRQRNKSTTYYNDPNGSITVSVNGGGAQGGASASNAFPTSLSVGAWYGAAMSSAAFDLGYGVSNAHVVISWNYPTGSWSSGSTAYDVAVTPFYNVPAAPTGVTATRVNDTSATLAWATHATGTAPYTSQQVYRSENGGAAIDTAPLSGSAASYAAATVANRKYTFTIQARNSAGSTSSTASNVLLTTPAKLASLSGAKVAGGIDLTLSKLDVPYAEAQVVVDYTTDGGSTWSAARTFNASELSTTAPTVWTHTSAPSGGTVQYRATVRTNGGTQGVLSAPATLSNAMVLNVPPLAPTNLTPSGLVDVASPVVLAWEHTPSADGAAQSSRQLQYSTDAGTTQATIITGNSTAQSYSWTVPTGSFTAGQTIQWRVRTAGSQPGTYGAWSTWQTLTLRASLTVDITSPSGTWEGGEIPVTWAVAASWGSASQVGYQLVMTSGATVVYDSGSVASAALTATIPAAVQRNLTAYAITVIVTDNYGLTSLPDTSMIDTDFLAPQPVGLSWAYDDELGQLILTPAFDPGTSSPLDDTVAWMLERSFDGVTWTVLGRHDGDDPVSDPLARIGATSWYRTVGYTALGVAGDQTVHEVPRADVASRWARIAYGEGFTEQVRFGWSQTVEVDAGRASEVYEVEGVRYPVAVFGAPRSRRVAVSGKLLYASSAAAGGIPASLVTASDDDMIRLQEDAAVCLFRDARGAWWTGRVTDMKVTPKGPAVPGQPDEAAVSFTIERVTV